MNYQSSHRKQHSALSNKWVVCRLELELKNNNDFQIFKSCLFASKEFVIYPNRREGGMGKSACLLKAQALRIRGTSGEAH